MIYSIYKTKKKCQGAPYGSYPRTPRSLATPLMSGENRKERQKKLIQGLVALEITNINSFASFKYSSIKEIKAIEEN